MLRLVPAGGNGKKVEVHHEYKAIGHESGNVQHTKAGIDKALCTIIWLMRSLVARIRQKGIVGWFLHYSNLETSNNEYLGVKMEAFF